MTDVEIDIENWTVDYVATNASECLEAIKTLESLDSFPLLTQDTFKFFKDGDLVRVQGMIQDIFNPEYFYSVYQTRNIKTGETVFRSGKYRDVADCKPDEEIYLDKAIPEERAVCFLIPVPGLSNWVQDNIHKPNKLEVSESNSTNSSSKRSLEESDNEDMVSEANETSDNGTESEEMPVESEEDMAAGGNGSSDNQTNTKEMSDESEESDEEERSDIIHYLQKSYPLPGKYGLPFLLKIYEDKESGDEGESIVLNNRIEAVGFLSLNPALAYASIGNDHEAGRDLPPSLVPRVHVIHYRSLVHCNPLVPQIIESYPLVTPLEKSRSSLLHVLTQLFFGDSLAADFMLCHLISRVYARTPYQPLGKFSVNVFNIKLDDYARRFSEVLETLVPQILYMPLSIEFLNKKSFSPHKHYESNKLRSAILQLADDTHLIIDETQMDEGKLDDTGCRNINALQNIIEEQIIRYNFTYYDVEYYTDFPVLVLSEGKSMLQPDVHIKLKMDTTRTIDDMFDHVEDLLTEDMRNELRMYLTSIKHMDFEMSEELTRKIGEDYVKMRQLRKGTTTQDLHVLLTVARYIALSYGRSMLNFSDWAQALSMENKRKDRLE